MYQKSAPASEPARMAPEMISEMLIAGISYLSKRLRFNVPNITQAEVDFLGEQYRPEPRHYHKTLSGVIALARRSVNPADREMLEALMRRCMGVPARDHTEAFTLETTAVAEVDPLQRSFELAPSRTTAEPLRNALLGQMHGTRAALDAVEWYCQ